MSGAPERLDDDVLARQLERRATGARLSVEDRERLIAAATATQVLRPGPSRWSIFSAPIAAALVVALVAGVTILGSIATGPADTPPEQNASHSSAATVTPAVTAPARLEDRRALTPAEVEALLTAPSDRGMDTVIVADVTVDVTPESPSSCYSAGICLMGTLRLPSGPVPIYAAHEVHIDPSPGELRGWSAVLISPPGFGPRLTYMGSVPMGSFGLSSTVAEVLARAAEIDAGGLFVVEGWLVRGGDGNIRCGRPDDDPFDGPFRCEPTDWIAESPDEPILTDDGSGWLRMPGPALTVQPNATGTFARYDPEADGPPEPRLEAFLVQANEDVSIDCGGCHQWQLLGRIDAVGPPEPVEAPQPGPTLPPLVVRAEATVPDANVALPQALALVSTTRRWFIVAPGAAGGDLVDRPLAAASVDVEADRASIEFHDYGDGRTFLALLRLDKGEAMSLDIVTVIDEKEATLSAWEEDEAGRIALEDTEVGSWGGTFARSIVGVPCPAGPGWCASVELVTDEFVDPPIVLAEVIVDIGREEVVHEDPPRPAPPAMSSPPTTPRPESP